MSKNILITGSGGFIGKNLKEFLQDKYNLFTPRSFEMNLLDEAVVKAYLLENKIDTVIHCAAYGTRIKSNDTMEEIGQQNIFMFQNIAKNLPKDAFMINLGSGAEYDKSQPLNKVKEGEFGNSVPKDSYGYSKYVISKEIENHSNIINLRLFGVYGKYEDESRFITYAINQNLAKKPIEINQNVIFDYLYIEDLCQIIEHFIKNKSSEKFLNVTPSQSISLFEIAEIVNEISDFKSEIIVKNAGLNNEYSGYNAKFLKEMVGFDFTPFEEGIKSLFKFLKLNLQTFIK
jgi:GDP-L-fucose synthase